MEIIGSPLDAYIYLRSRVSFEQEEFWVLALNSQKCILGSHLAFRGSVDYCTVHMRDIFRFACSKNASGILVAHSHPSGSDLPSSTDIKTTKALIRASEMMEIPVFDHLILTVNGYRSLLPMARKKGAIQF